MSSWLNSGLMLWILYSRQAWDLALGLVSVPAYWDSRRREDLSAQSFLCGTADSIPGLVVLWLWQAQPAGTTPHSLTGSSNLLYLFTKAALLFLEVLISVGWENLQIWIILSGTAESGPQVKSARLAGQVPWPWAMGSQLGKPPKL